MAKTATVRYIDDVFAVRFLDDVTVSSDRAAAIESIKVKAGDAVKQGDVLATFSREGAEQSELDLKIAQTKMQSAQQEYDRGKALRENGQIQEAEFERQRLAFELAELEFKKQKLALDQLGRPLVSPAAGVVAEVFKKPGEFVAAATPIVRVVNTDRFAVEGRINIHRSAVPQRGQEFRFTLHPYGKRGEAESRVYEGKIDYVSTEVNPVDGSLNVRGTIENRDGILRAGMQGKFELAGDEAEAAEAAAPEPLDYAQAGAEMPGKFFGMQPNAILTTENEIIAKSRYRGGVEIGWIDPAGAAAAAGIREGDVLVGLVKWKTASYEDIGWILHQPESSPSEPLKFYILRNGETLFGSFVFNRDYFEKDGWVRYIQQRQKEEAETRNQKKE
jgi:RND family efflux transporter MFP subunit